MPILQCKRCGHEWIPRGKTKPERCPNCNSPYWNKSYKRKIYSITIPISKETKEKLTSLKKNGETYDDVIKRIID